MNKLTGYYAVAEIVQGCYEKKYYYAIYNDGETYKTGDSVLVSGAAKSEVQIINDIISPDDKKITKNITAEVICKVNTEEYNKRIENRKKAAEIRKQMDKKIRELDESKKYEKYAEDDDELRELLNKYKDLIK